MRAAVPGDENRSLFGRRSFHFEHHDSLIVEGLHSFGMVGDGAEDRLRDFVGAAASMLKDSFLQPSASKHVAGGTGSVGDAIAQEEKDVVGFAAQNVVLVGGVGEQTYRRPVTGISWNFPLRR